MRSSKFTGRPIGMYSSFVLIPQLVELPTETGFGFGSSVTEAGLFLLPSTLMMLVVSPIAGRLSIRVGSKVPLVLGPIPETFKGDPNSYAALKEAGAAVLGWGQFVTVVINFLILAFVIFLIVRQANKIKKADAAAGPSEVDLLTEIRDELKKR